MTGRSWLRRWWPWIVFPLVALGLNAVLFAVIEEPEPEIEVIRLRPGAQHVSVGEGSVWVTGFDDVALTEVDPGANRASDPIDVRVLAGDSVVAAGSVWVGANRGNEIARVDRASGSVEILEVGETPHTLAAGFGRIWVAALDEADVMKREGGGNVFVLDEATGALDSVISIGHDFPAAIATGFGRVWVADNVDDVLLEIDPESGEVVRTIEVGTSPQAIAVGEGSVWVAHFGDGTVHRIDPATGETIVRKPLVIEGGLTDIAVGDGFVWVTSSEEKALVQLDPEDNEEERRFAVGENPQGVAFAFDSVWVVSQEQSTLTRISL